MPRPTAVIPVEGVLRKPSGVPDDAGRRLYHGLAGTYRIVLVALEADSAVQMSEWLGMEGFTKHDHIVYPMGWARGIRIPQWLNIARSLKLGYGYDVDVIVVTDPADAKVLIENGYSTMLWTRAAYALPEWRPDHKAGVQPWADLTAEIEAQRAARATDNRMREGEP